MTDAAAVPGPHRVPVQVRFCDLDPYDHVNHTVLVAYFEIGRVEALASVGMGLDRLKTLDTNLLVVSIRTRFLAPGRLGDALVVESGLAEVGRVRATWLQRIVIASAEPGDETVVATQIVTSAATNGAGRPRRFSDDLVTALAPYGVAPDWLGSSAPRD